MSERIVFGENTARFLGSKTDKNGHKIETYAVDKTADPGAAFMQAELFRGAKQDRWTAWEGPNWRNRATLRALEAARNALEATGREGLP